MEPRMLVLVAASIVAVAFFWPQMREAWQRLRVRPARGRTVARGRRTAVQTESSNWVWVCLAIGAGLLVLLLMQPGAPGPPSPPPTLDLVPAFRAADSVTIARQDALAFAECCRAVAAKLEYDGAAAKPRITSAASADDLRRWTREYGLEGGSFGAKYPALQTTIKAYLDGEVGATPGEFTAALRSKWVQAMRAVEASARHAAAVL